MRSVFATSLLLGLGRAIRLPTPATGPLRGSLPASFELPNGKSVILFDGVCNFCNAWVNFVLGEQSTTLPLGPALTRPAASSQTTTPTDSSNSPACSRRPAGGSSTPVDARPMT